MQRVLFPWMLLLSLLLPLAGHAQAPPPEPGLRVVLLGTAGGPVIRSNRVGIGTLVLAGDQVLLFDVGRGVAQLTGLERPLHPIVRLVSFFATQLQ